ncbi:tandem-95 repeat protein [Roseomonas sp. AR75]|uniref:tandem-95 repeat protein n=1 Tax=Roseomonas sp. AR75 TaxID=2562311 RepID=UPI0014850C4A|nr:tandem-95 repeat protein [Roseomonas sp. AR75]
MAIEQIWFGIRAVRFESAGTSGPQFELLESATDFAIRDFGTKVVDYTGSEWQQLLAFTGSAAAQQALGIDLSDGVNVAASGQVSSSGDLRVGQGVTAQNIADVAGGGRVFDVTGTLDESDDAVAITGLGKANAGRLSGASLEGSETGNRVMFSNDTGFGFLNGSGFDPNGGATRLNEGDAINFEIKQGKVLVAASFTVRVANGGSAGVVIDSDGKTIADTNGDKQGGWIQDASAGELMLGMLTDGAKVKIDYVGRSISIDDVAFAGDAAAFFDAFSDGGAKDLTLGSLVSGAIGWSADDLVLSTDDPAEANAVPLAEGFTGGVGEEDSGIAGAVQASDGDGDLLSFSVEAGDGPAHGSVEIEAGTGAFLYTPDPDFHGADSFTVTIRDGRGGTALQLVEIAVAAVNDAPEAAAEIAIGTNEDAAVSFDIAASDPDGDPLTFTIAVGDGPAHGVVDLDAGSGAVTYTPDADFSGADGFTVTISDGQGGVTAQFVGITVAPMNDAPVAQGFTGGTGAEDAPILGSVQASDPDADDLVFTVEAGDGPFNGGVLLDGDSGAFTYTPDPDFFGSDSFTVTIRDGHGGVTLQVVEIVVEPTGDAPVAQGYTGGVGEEDSSIAGDVNASDADNDALTYSIQAGDEPAHGSVLLLGSTGEFWYSPDTNFSGTDSFTVTISDGKGGTATQLVDITVAPVADPASFTGTTGGDVMEDGALMDGGTLTVIDPDPGEAGFLTHGSLAGAYGDFTFLLATGEWTYTLRNADPAVQALNTGDSLQDSLQVTALDGTTTTITVDIAGRDEAFLPSPFTGAGDPNDNPPTPPAPGGSYVVYGDGANNIAGTSGADRIDGGGGNDTITGGSNADGLVGGNGDDNVTGNTGNDWIDGGPGNDVLSGGGNDDVVIGGGGNDTLNGGAGGSTMYGGDDHDSLNGNPLLYGGAGNDTLTGSTSLGDTLYGGSGNDTIRGRGGDDTLIGGYGADTLAGGAGGDHFVFLSVHDTNDVITDFGNTGDQLDFSAFGGLTLKDDPGASFTANNQIAWYLSGSATVVIVNTDGNAANAEFMVTLNNLPAGITAADLIL